MDEVYGTKTDLEFVSQSESTLIHQDKETLAFTVVNAKKRQRVNYLDWLINQIVLIDGNRYKVLVTGHFDTDLLLREGEEIVLAVEPFPDTNMSKFITIKIWRKTLKKLKLICAYSGNSMVKEIDDFAERRLEELGMKRKMVLDRVEKAQENRGKESVSLRCL